MREHKFKPRTLDDTGRSDKPIDGNDHAISALEWIVMELPANEQSYYGIYDKSGQDITKPTRNIYKAYGYWALQDENEESYDYEFGGW